MNGNAINNAYELIRDTNHTVAPYSAEGKKKKNWIDKLYFIFSLRSRECADVRVYIYGRKQL